MALTYRILRRSCHSLYPQITKPVQCGFSPNNNLLRVAASGICYRTPPLQRYTVEEIRLPYSLSLSVRQCATDKSHPDKPAEQPPKPGLVKRFKQMTRDYWYVLVPVHLATSAVWLGAFYYAVRR